MRKHYFKSLACLSLAGFLAMLFPACQQEDPTPENNPPVTRSLSAQELKTIRSSNNFAFRSFAEISKLEGEKNVFISPFSLSTALTMAYNGANGATKEAIKQTLSLEDATDEEINQSYKTLLELLSAIDKKVEFTSANSMWLNNLYQLQAPFVSNNQTYFDATLKALDFSSPNAKTEINDWVKDKTKGKIPTIVENVTPDHLLFLINAIYFKGTWTYPFQKDLTKNRPFKLEDGSTVSHPFMTMNSGKYLMYSDASKMLIDLPYGNKQFSMTIIVPQEQHTLQAVMGQLSASNLENWLTAADSSTTTLHMPKFKMSLKYDNVIRQALENLGMGVAFSAAADFSKIFQSGNAAISEVNHKTFLEVNEEGTEAAAATSVGFIYTSVPASLVIDKPFIFLIREKSTNAILFFGKMMNPE